MRSDFIKGFIEAFLDQKLLPNLMRRESMHFKNLRLQGFDPHRIYQGYYNLKRRGLVHSDQKGYRLTVKGVTWLRISALKYSLSKNKKWDKKWRIVVFDIPDELHKNRVFLRRKLLNLGFYPMQKSIYVYPYPCEMELGFLCEHLKIEDHVDIIIAETVGFKEEEIKKFFFLN